MKNIIGNLGRAFVVALALTASQAIGQIITQSQDFAVVGSSDTQTLTFDKFDTSLGTLTSVTVAINNVVLSGSVSITNQGASAAGYNIALIGNYFLYDDLENTIASNQKTTYFPGPNQSSTVNLGSGNTYNPGPVSTAPVSTSTVYTSSEDLASYEGTGFQQISLTLEGNNIATSTRNNATYQVTSSIDGAGTVVVTYNYTPTPVPTPEPSTWALMIVSGLGAAFFFRRRLALVA